jgi:hypothetical protein
MARRCKAYRSGQLRKYVLIASCGLVGALAACQTPKAPVPDRAGVSVSMEEEPAWRKVATTEDVGRLDRLSSAWSEALADARRSSSRQVNAEGDLLKPDAGLARASPPPGSYRCRVIKLGATKPRARAFTAHKPFFCHIGVSDDQLSITKQTGTQRPGGYLWDTEKTSQMIFLGSMALGNEDVPLPYGQNPARDMAGVFERYGDYRYRLVVPWPRQDSKLDVFELIPLVPQPE